MGAIRKLFTTGVGAALMTESNLRNAVTQRALRGKEELTKVLAGEIRKFLDHINLHEEIQKALEGLVLEIEASIRITSPKSKNGRPFHLKKVSVKKS